MSPNYTEDSNAQEWHELGFVEYICICYNCGQEHTGWLRVNYVKDRCERCGSAMIDVVREDDP